MAALLNRKRRRAWPSLAAAAGATGLAALLITGAGTTAELSDRTSQPAQRITAGGLSLQIDRSVSWPSVAGSAAGVAGRTAEGIIPGVRGAKVTFTLRNSGESAVPAGLTGQISAPKTSAWEAAQSFTTISAAGSGNCTAGTAATGGGTISIPISSTQPLVPGTSCTITVDVGIGRYNPSGADAALELRGQRLADLAAFTLAATLTQSPR